MNQVLIFSGTTEGRQLAELLAENGMSCMVCVATEYGLQVMEKRKNLSLHQGRLEQLQMEQLMAQEEFAAVVDATHPFAAEVSLHIKSSASKLRLPYLRLKRKTDCGFYLDATEDTAVCYFESNEACAGELVRQQGNILLTTGSKKLSVYCREEGLKKRLYVRVLPGMESIEQCKKWDISGKQILALQGPFSEQLNRALIKEYQIKYLVTKESGAAGGFLEKVSAAKKEGVTLCVIGSPDQTEGTSFSGVCKELEMLTGRKISKKAGQLEISLLGTGMGNKAGMTWEAEKKIETADYLFGAGRLLKDYAAYKEVFPYYLAKDILPYLDQLLQRTEESRIIKIGILFSGDSGFYSGCESLYRELLIWKEQKEADILIRIYPGISSVSCLAASFGVSWQDAAIRSIHGKSNEEEWKACLLETVRYRKKTFLLLSGVEDLKKVGRLLQSENLSGIKILAGYEMTCSGERLLELRPGDCENLWEEGLYTCLLVNDAAQKRPLTCGRRDTDFIRGKVPMTKEEVREVVLCKLRLYEGAVVYDIGSGTGSVAVEIAERSASVQVYAIERKEEAAALIMENCRRFWLSNVRVIQEEAPEGLLTLPKPTHAFIGGSGGRLKEILQVLYEKNPRIRIVLTAVSLETISELTGLKKSLPVAEAEMVQMQVNRVRQAGSSHLARAENPVFIYSLIFKENDGSTDK